MIDFKNNIRKRNSGKVSKNQNVRCNSYDETQDKEKWKGTNNNNIIDVN